MRRAIETTDDVLAVLKTMTWAVYEAGDSGLPSGHLYAMLMPVLDIHQYNLYIGALERKGLISNTGHLLRYTGPTLTDSPTTNPAPV